MSLELPGWLAVAEEVFIGYFGPSYHESEAVFHAALVIPLLLLFVFLSTRRLEKIPTGLQNFAELLVELLSKFCTSLIGPHGLAFLPLIGALFLYIFTMNMFGLIPGFKSPTSNVNVTCSLALVTFVATHYYGFRYQGMGYLKHFAGEPLWLAPLMFPIHIVGELARPLSLTLRLYGNIMGEDTAIAVFIGMGIGAGYLPFQFPMMALAVFTSFVQAMIFALLSSIYISGATTVHEHHAAHGEEHGHGAHGAAQAPAHA
ncbi:MAG: F0F1 ATP synthase subunit A [Planctomycetes bacterium]|nr:F0F1 ATP synthase subunit A [Planctomycetota bacterium]